MQLPVVPGIDTSKKNKPVLARLMPPPHMAYLLSTIVFIGSPALKATTSTSALLGMVYAQGVAVVFEHFRREIKIFIGKKRTEVSG